MTGRDWFLKARSSTLVAAVLAAALMIGGTAPAVRADTVTDANVESMLASAKTAADHQALADYFTAKAKEAQSNIDTHKRMSGLFSGKGKSSWEAHCRSLIKTYEQEAKDYTALANEQTAVAKALAK